MRVLKWILMLGIFGAIGGSAALACLDGMRPHELSGELVGIDVERPSRPEVELIEIWRGRGGRSLDNGMVEISSTDDLGMARFRVVSLEDDTSLSEHIGLRVVIIGEPTELAEEMVPKYDFRPFCFSSEDYPTFHLAWIDGATDTQEAISETFAVYAIDEAGNVSSEADTLIVVDPGRD